MDSKHDCDIDFSFEADARDSDVIVFSFDDRNSDVMDCSFDDRASDVINFAYVNRALQRGSCLLQASITCCLT